MCCLSSAFFISLESWARLLILPGFPHFGNLSGSSWSPRKWHKGCAGTSRAAQGSIPHIPGAAGLTGHHALPASALLFLNKVG